MSLNLRRTLILIIFGFILSICVYTIVLGGPWLAEPLSIFSIASFVQRISGLLLFIVLFIQISVGSFMVKWTEEFGAKAYLFHITLGITGFCLLLIHPLMQSLLDLESGGVTYALIQLLPRFDNYKSYYMVFGKVALVLLFLGIVAGLFRTKKFLRRYWIYFHRLNYIAFYVASYHAYKLGTDVRTTPFIWLFWFALIVVTGILVYKLTRLFLQRT